MVNSCCQLTQKTKIVKVLRICCHQTCCCRYLCIHFKHWHHWSTSCITIITNFYWLKDAMISERKTLDQTTLDLLSLDWKTIWSNVVHSDYCRPFRLMLAIRTNVVSINIIWINITFSLKSLRLMLFGLMSFGLIS